MREKIPACMVCHDYDCECLCCGGADDDHRKVNMSGGAVSSVSKPKTEEERKAFNEQKFRVKLKRKEARYFKTMTGMDLPENSTLEAAMRALQEKAAKEEREMRYRNRQIEWFGRIVDGSEPLVKPMDLLERIIWRIIK